MLATQQACKHGRIDRGRTYFDSPMMACGGGGVEGGVGRKLGDDDGERRRRRGRAQGVGAWPACVGGVWEGMVVYR